MSKFKVKAVLDDVVKTIEYDRSYLPQFNDLKSQFERKFGVSSVGIRFKYADGRLQAIYQDLHIQEALKDCEKNGSRTLVFSLNREGPNISTTQAKSVPTQTQTQTAIRPTYSTTTAPPPTSTSPTPYSSSQGKFCEMCGTSLAPTAKFCSSCGHSGGGSSSAPTQSSPSHSSSSSSGPVCGGCKNAISSSAVKALDKIWHKECFVCKKCHKSLMETSFAPADDGSAFCSQCYDEQYGTKCGKCGNAISGSYLSVSGQAYHKECFVCTNCGNQFDQGYFMKNDKPFCKNCI